MSALPATLPAEPFPERSATTRLDARPLVRRQCLECGIGYQTAAGADFCSEGHRKAWNNRRLIRGAELFDLVMCWRHQRGLAAKAKVLRSLCRMTAMFRAEDVRERDGRPSWRPPAEIIARRPYLLAERVGPMKRKDTPHVR